MLCCASAGSRNIRPTLVWEGECKETAVSGMATFKPCEMSSRKHSFLSVEIVGWNNEENKSEKPL